MASPFEGKYEVVAKLREGGMGAIYKARHVFLDQYRVIKVMKPWLAGDADAARRFQREAELANRLSHPNLAAVLDYAQGPDRSFYIVMEYVEGVTLSEYVARAGHPPPRLGMEIVLQALSALAYLHQEGIVHRDVAPDNVMLTRDRRGRLVVKLIDLGIAKQTDAESGTSTGMFVGKLRFASPEQLDPRRFASRLDGRADLYALGCVFYWLLTGQYPFHAQTFTEYAALHMFQPPPPFDETDPAENVPGELREVVLRCLEKDREQRWPSADVLAARLTELLATLDLGALSVPGGEWLRPSEPDEPLLRPGSDARSRVALAFPASTPTPSRTTLKHDDDETLIMSEALTSGAARPAGAERRRARALLLVGALLVAAAAIGSATLKRRAVASPTPAPFGSLVLTAEPWARIRAIEGLDTESPPPPLAAYAPASVRLPPGRYRVTFEADAFGSVSQLVEVRARTTSTAHVRMPGFDLEKAVLAYAR